MTTHTPFEPPHGSYPTSPPWAPPDPPAPETPTWAGVPYTPHGRLMVPYPEEMFNASRPQPPSWVPVVLFTFFFGAFGAISAARRAAEARSGRNDRHPYWIAFGATMAAGLAAWSVAAAIWVPVYLDVRENAVTKTVESSMTATGNGVTATECEPTGDRAAGGRRTYLCQVSLSDGRTGEIRVTADAEGHWKPIE